MIRSALILAAACCLASVAGTAPAQTAPNLPSGKRPHSRAAVYVHREVVVRRILFRGRRVEGRIRGTMGFAVENRSGEDRTVVLRAGRCTGGQLSYPSCPSAYRLRVRIPAGGRRSAFRQIVLRQPTPSQDTIELSVTASEAARPPYGTSRHLGNLLLRGRAWRGDSGTWYRYDTPRRTTGPAIVRARLDVPALSATAVRPVLSWQADRAGDLATTLQACEQIDPCIGRLAARSWITSATLQDRVVVRADGAEGLRMEVADGDRNVLQIVLPWPL